MADTPQISVIIASYNIAPYVLRAVDSALHQQGVTLEVIVVDDGSSDATWDSISAITDPRVTILRMEHNGGPSAARNRGLAAARGEWIAVLDGDDVFYPGRLARMLALAEAQQVDIVVDNQYAVHEADGAQTLMFDSKKLARTPLLTTEGLIAGNANFIEGYTYGYFKPIFRAAFLRQHRLTYRESMRIGEDYIFLLEALASGARCVINPTAGYAYTVRKGSVSHRLNHADVARIQHEDALFMARYSLSDTALGYQRIRARNLVEAYGFNVMVDAIKTRTYGRLIKTALKHPMAVRHLWVLVRVRLVRLSKRLG
jgi:succinoglycan biosynthesis protein ExoO